MENILSLLCNQTTFNIVARYHSIYYFDGCFQQFFLVAPIYLIVLILSVFYLGFYRCVPFLTSIYLSGKVDFVALIRYLSLVLLALCQIVQYFLFGDDRLLLVYRFVAILKIAATVASLSFLLKCTNIFTFEKSFRLYKLVFILVLLSNISECITCYYSSLNQALIGLNIASAILWGIYSLFIIIHFNHRQYAAELLVNVSDDDQVLLECDEQMSYLSRLFFSWVTALLNQGVKSNINSSKDLFELPYSLNSISICHLVNDYLNMYKIAQNYSLIKMLFKKFLWLLIILGSFKFVADFLTFLSPIFLNKLLFYLESDDFTSSDGFQYAFVLFLSTFLNATIISLFNFEMSKISLQVRTILVTITYHKLFRVRLSALINRFGTGQILNLANTDIDRVANFLPSLFQFISLPIQLVITLYLLYHEIGLASLAGVVFILTLIPLNKIICNKIGIFSQEMMKWKDKRIKLMSEILKGIRTIKMHFWEQSFIDKIEIYRLNEVKYLRLRKYLDALCVYFWATTPVIISSLVFGTYAYYNGTQSLTSSKVFTSLALLGMLIMPLNALPWVLNGLMEALVSMRRLDAFFSMQEIDLNKDYDHSLLDHDGGGNVFEMDNCCFSYFDDSSVHINKNRFKLSQVNLDVPKKSFIGIIGKVGSGKSSLLKSLLNELNKTEGVIRIESTILNKGIGFVSQVPWVQNTTVRDNILFGKEFIPEFYHKVIDSCALYQDFQSFGDGDLTLVGDHGAMLSGGQKARISLARALYQNFDVYLIDEPFSSVDCQVAEEIYQKCILTLLKDKCILLVTNHVQYLERANTILCLDQGRITHSIAPVDLSEDSIKNELISQNDTRKTSTDEDNVNDIEINNEAREYGVVKFSIYVTYMQSIGYFLFAMILLFICLMQLSKSFSDFWLSIWVQNKDTSLGLRFLYIFIAIAVANSIITLVRAFIFAYGGVKAAVTMHDKLLNYVMKTLIQFFDSTAFGIIINRFSTDVFNVDDALPFTLNIFLAQLSGLIASLIVTVYGLPWILFVILPLIIPYYFIQKFFRATSRELKRLSAVSLSPIYTQLDDTIQGLVTIRSFAQIKRFKENFYNKVNTYNQIQYAINAIQQWLNLRLQLLGVIVTSAVAFISVFMHYYHSENVNSSLVGLSLVYSLSLTSLLNGVVQAFTQTELDLISVERISQILKIIQTDFRWEQSDLALIDVDSEWPDCGIVCFRNVSMRYREDLELALNNISFETKPFEHIAIIGRTGSGKSSIFQTLFRLTNIESGLITIDGVDISKISFEVLRNKIFIIPQDPFLFSSTIRENLDPSNQYRDDEIWTALFSCNINILVDSLGGLDAELRENGKDLSVGQRHLFCLARAVLNKRTILCMDEVTANIDSQTEMVLHELTRTALKLCTIFHITHKIDLIKNYDRVIVMESGKLVHFYSPAEYIQLNERYGQLNSN